LNIVPKSKLLLEILVLQHEPAGKRKLSGLKEMGIKVRSLV
jgi:hypothetical protein